MTATLLNRIRSIILENLDNENFSVKDLAIEVGISRFQLYRKIQILTNKSVSKFISEVRLEYALELLKKGELTVSEVAYQVGFSSPSYFNKCFKELYGISPGEIKSNHNLKIETHEKSIEVDSKITDEQTVLGHDNNNSGSNSRGKSILLKKKPNWIIAASLVIIIFISILLLNRDNLFSPTSENRDSEVKYLNILLPEEVPLSFSNIKQALPGQSAFDISRDGSKIVYVSEIEGEYKLVLRNINQNNVKILSGTDGAYSPFFSPDGLWVGYFTRDAEFQGKLKKVSLNTGISVDLCEASNPFGGDWGENGTIVFADVQGAAIKIVSEKGGMPKTLNTTIGNKKFTKWISFPKFLPGANRIIATCDPSVVIDIKTGQVKTLTDGGNSVCYIKTGHVIFVKDSKLMAAPFNLESFEISGNSFPLFEGIRTENLRRSGQFAISENGYLLFAEGSAADLTRFVWVNRNGEITDTLNIPAGQYETFSISPSGKLLAYTLSDQVWIYYFDYGNKARVPASYEIYIPFLSPDDDKVVFCGNSVIQEGISYFSLSGENEILPLFTFDGLPTLNDWSTDNKFIGFHSNQDLYVYSIDDDTILPVLKTDQFESQIEFSPDSRYFCYLTEENGFLETFVQPFPVTGEKWNVSNGMGFDAIWSFDGKEIFYRTNTQFFVVKVNVTPEFTLGKPELLFTNKNFMDVGLKSFAVSPDRQKILVLNAEDYENTTRELTIIENWFNQLNTEKTK